MGLTARAAGRATVAPGRPGVEVRDRRDPLRVGRVAGPTARYTGGPGVVRRAPSSRSSARRCNHAAWAETRAPATASRRTSLQSPLRLRMNAESVTKYVTKTAPQTGAQAFPGVHGIALAARAQV